VYRDERGALQARLDAALEAQRAAAAEVQDRVAAVAALNAQLENKGLGTTRLPAIECAPADEPSQGAGSGVGFGMADLVTRAGELEADAERLTRESERLSDLLRLLNDRIMGRKSPAMPLGATPRAVPARAAVLEFFGGVWSVARFTIFFPPVWAAPFLDPALGFLALAVLCLVGVLRAKSRYDMWRFGVMASPTVMERGDENASYTNWTMRYAEGWHVRSKSYTGQGHKTVLNYMSEDGETHAFVVKGMPYGDGVILYDSRRPARALAVQDFAYPLQPDHRGELQAQPTGLGGAFRTILAALALFYLAAASFGLAG
jgi:hypothetical protein